jgi:hypothetical protein
MLQLSADGGEEAWLRGVRIPPLLEALKERVLTLARACRQMLSRMHWRSM